MLDLYATMVRIRKFEEKATELFLAAKLAGFIHVYIGEEAIAAGVCAHLTPEDFITSTHRGHGHVIAKGGRIDLMMAELYGKATGYGRGKSGSMHIADFSVGVLGANGIVAAGLPIASGAAFALRYRQTDRVVVAFFGDGATSRGTFHESLNLASVWNLPVVFVCENNGYAVSTPQRSQCRVKDISQRAAAYGIPGVTVDGNDVLAVYEAAGEAIARARRGEGPTLLECKTWRHFGHFVGDPQIYKDPEEQRRWLERDPIPAFEKRLLELGIAPEELARIQAQAAEEIAAAVRYAEASPDPRPEELYTDVYAG
jgi:pyruvate dehydrogenase E1 component alpha subunit